MPWACQTMLHWSSRRIAMSHLLFHGDGIGAVQQSVGTVTTAILPNYIKNLAGNCTTSTKFRIKFQYSIRLRMTSSGGCLTGTATRLQQKANPKKCTGSPLGLLSRTTPSQQGDTINFWTDAQLKKKSLGESSNSDLREMRRGCLTVTLHTATSTFNML
jgi:hypothetical protein